MSRPLGSVNQIGYVVHDMCKAMRWWTEVVGAGPFFYVERLTLQHFTYRGQESPSPEVGFAVGQSGDLQIELLQQHDDTPSMYREFLDHGQEGVHHIAYFTERFDDDAHHLLSQGMQVHQAGESVTGGPNARFAYFVDEHQIGTVVELCETSGPKGPLYRQVAEAALGWDGRDPFRELDVGSSER